MGIDTVTVKRIIGSVEHKITAQKRGEQYFIVFVTEYPAFSNSEITKRIFPSSEIEFNMIIREAKKVLNYKLAEKKGHKKWEVIS